MMWVMSKWATMHVLGVDTNTPDFAIEYPGVGWGLAEDRDPTPGARVLITVPDPPAALLTDYRYPEVKGGPPVVFEDYRQGMREAHDLRLAALLVNVQVGKDTLRLPGTMGYQTYLAHLVNDARAGHRVFVLRTAGAVYPVTALTFGSIYRQYRAALRSHAGRDEIGIRGAIEAARSRGDLDAICFA